MRDAVARRVDVFTIVYGDGLPLPGRVYVHSYSSPEAVFARLGCRLSMCVADHDQAAIGGVTEEEYQAQLTAAAASSTIDPDAPKSR